LTGGGNANSYSWSGGVTNGVAFVPTATKTYTVTGTNSANGCQSTATTTVTVNPLPTVTANASANTVCAGASVTLTGGGDANSYTWSGGVTNGVSFAPTATNTYTVTGTNSANGCQNIATVSITVGTSLDQPIVSQSGATTFCQGGNVTLSTSSANSYQWSNGETSQNTTISSSGTYTVTIYDGTGCSATSSPISVMVNPLPTVTANASANAICAGESVILNGGGNANSYTWSGGATNNVAFLPSTTNTYTVTGTNSTTSCQNTATTTVTVNPLPTVTANSSASTVCTGESVTLTGGGDASAYSWSDGVVDGIAFVPSSTNTYAVTGTNSATGCQNTATTTITALQATTVSTSLANATCGNANGTATANSQNGIALAGFLWSSGATTQTATGLAAGTYTVTVTDVNGCTATASVNIIATPVATLTLTPTNTTCGNNDGKVTVSTAGGSPIASYLWSNGATTQNLLNVPGGAYSVTATDGHGCQIMGSATVIGLTNPSVDLGQDLTFQQGQQAVLDATGPGLTYEWSTGATTPTITVTTMGSYSVTVTNSSSCTATDELVVTVTTSADDQSHRHKITVSPNPALDIIYLKCEGSATTSVELFDNLGRLLISDPSFAPDGDIRTMQLEKLPSGTYHIKVSGRDFSRTVSLVKQ
jgi:hypothetical protein